MTHTSSPAGRWWSWWLVAHAGLVTALVVADRLTAVQSISDSALPQVISILVLVLGSPWWLPLGFSWAPPVAWSNDALLGTVVMIYLPVLVNLVLHAWLRRVVQRLRADRVAGNSTARPVGAGRDRAGLGATAVLVAAGVLAWLLVFHLADPSDALPLGQIVTGAALVVVADAWALGVLSRWRVFLASWLSVFALGAWTLVRSDPLGGVGAIVWFFLTLVSIPLLLALAVALEKLVRWSRRRGSRARPG